MCVFLTLKCLDYIKEVSNSLLLAEERTANSTFVQDNVLKKQTNEEFLF